MSVGAFVEQLTALIAASIANKCNLMLCHATRMVESRDTMLRNDPQRGLSICITLCY